MEIEQEWFKISKLDFDVYSKLSGNHLIKLNLSFCKNIKIDLFIPIEITESLDKLNMSSGYFNDLCYTATSKWGTDITINDRKKEYIENNKTVCQEKCIFSDYNYKTKKAKCSCNIEEFSLPFIRDNIYI